MSKSGGEEAQQRGSENAPQEQADDAVSETPTERYERHQRVADGVWMSGLFSGLSYVPAPKKVDRDNLSEAAEEEMLQKKSYVVPRGYKYLEDEVPAILSPKPVGGLRTAMIVYIVFAVIGFICLLVASCPVPWYRGKNKMWSGVDYNKVKYSLWKQTGGNQPEIKVRDIQDCPIEKQFYFTISVSVIVGCCFSFMSIIAAIVKLSGKGGYGATLLLGFLGFSWALCASAMSMSQYHIDRCAKPRFVSIARLDAGFALSVVGWVFMLIATLVVTFATRLNIGPALKNLRVFDTFYMLILLVSLLFVVVANVSTVWKRRFNTRAVRVVRVTYWHTELLDGAGTSLIYGRAHYRCSAFNKRMKASVSFLILGSVSLFFAAMFGIAGFVKRGCRIASCVLSIITSVFLIVSWVTAVAVFYRKLCTRAVPYTMYRDYPGVPSGVFEGYTKFDGYGVQEGVILVIIAWVLVTAAAIVNFIVPWEPVEEGYQDE